MSQRGGPGGALTHKWLTHMLTDTKIRTLKPRETTYRVADTNGLCIEVRPSGANAWRYRYRHAGKPSIITMAEYPAMGLAEARAERDRLRALVKGGGNLANAARIEKAAKIEQAATTFGAIAYELLNKRAKEGLSPGSVKRERRLIEKDMAAIGGMPITEVTAPLLLASLRKLERRGVVETAHRARSFAGRVFRYAIATSRAKSSPANDLVGALEQPQVKHFASVTDPAKIGDLLRAMYSYQGSQVTVAALKLAPMLFVRPGELRKARWSDIDLTTAEWRFIASKTGTPHIVRLSTQAKEILIERVAVDGDAEQAAEIASVVRDLIDKGVSAEEIAVLLAKRNKGSLYKMIQGHRLPQGASSSIEAHRRPNSVLVDTVARFKGLESPAVLLWIGDEVIHDGQWETVYVGTTRAKSPLYIIGSKHSTAVIGSEH